MSGTAAGAVAGSVAVFTSQMMVSFMCDNLLVLLTQYKIQIPCTSKSSSQTPMLYEAHSRAPVAGGSL